MSTSTSADAIDVGAGVVSASCAYHLAIAGVRVLIAETFGGPAEGSTGPSFASIRSPWAGPAQHRAVLARHPRVPLVPR